jgi:hypothetical protein
MNFITPMALAGPGSWPDVNPRRAVGDLPASRLVVGSMIVLSSFQSAIPASPGA